ncbi:REP-associated tyrosine transposase [Pseudoduganella rhizocola]|uniref:REP-associated tyrosine transposase n=1 Tax=Pseudoduganella rhizocola TaxID=3382643 RepID=UPI0038B4EAF1
MARPVRILYPGALYHVTSRGNRRAAIYLDERDHLVWLDFLADTVVRHGLVVHAFVQMPNHYHLLAATPAANLSDSIYHLNSQYAQAFNKRHQLSGHVFQGRFYAEHIEDQSHLLALSRYIALNPVRAGLVVRAEDWRWGSFAILRGALIRPGCVDDSWLLGQFSGGDRHAQVASFCAFVEEGAAVGKPPLTRAEQRASRQAGMADAIRAAYRAEGCTTRELADRFGVSMRTVQRLLRELSG